MTAPRRVAFALGANLGDRAAALQAAVDGLASTPGVRAVAVSAVYATDPVGGPPDQPGYLNAVLVADSSLPAAELLARAHAIEQEQGRVRSERWGPRTLDVDLLAAGGETSQAEGLLLPHPRAHERAFVLVPWCDVDPAFEVPGRGPVAALVAGLAEQDRAGVRRAQGVALALPAAVRGQADS
ncbi:MAG: 2-amino-4-hydroxy-6-hydroxymethyldihydropteridine diphosphokinase [Actinomycetes bacterium]